MFKIIHIASHKGNIGDLINHQGFHDIFCQIFKTGITEKIELRNFYYSANNKQNWDSDFAEYINSFDLCVIGGGGFFDVRWKASETGTTLDMSEEFVQMVRTPILINAMGYHEYPDITNSDMCEKFYKFIRNVHSLSNWLVTVRNDGSLERIERRYGSDSSEGILKVADNGFFCKFLPNKRIIKECITIGMCITNDLFCTSYNGELKPQMFNLEISNIIEEQARKGKRIILFPHTPSDICIIYELFSNISGEIKRNNIIVAPFDANSKEAVNRLGKYYSQCDCFIGMRFHSLITAINLKIPAIALSGHAQIEALYKELGLEEYCVKLNNLKFSGFLNAFIDTCLYNRSDWMNRYRLVYEGLEKRKKRYQETVKKFLNL